LTQVEEEGITTALVSEQHSTQLLSRTLCLYYRRGGIYKCHHEL
jgi:hypothetical protein